MSKVVRSVGRAVGKVVGGIGKLVTKVTGSKTLGKIAKVVAGAALVYVTGGAIAGAVGTIGTSTSLLAGAQAGLSASWAGLTGAGSALMAGNLTGAGSALAGGWSSAAGAGAALQTVNPAVLSPLTGAASTVAAPLATAAPSLAAATAPVAGAAVPAAAAGGGNMLLKMAGVQALGGMASSAMQAKAQNDAEKRADAKEVANKQEYNRNMGADLVGTFEQFKNRQVPTAPWTTNTNLPPVFRVPGGR